MAEFFKLLLLDPGQILKLLLLDPTQLFELLLLHVAKLLKLLLLDSGEVELALVQALQHVIEPVRSLWYFELFIYVC